MTASVMDYRRHIDLDWLQVSSHQLHTSIIDDIFNVNTTTGTWTPPTVSIGRDKTSQRNVPNMSDGRDKGEGLQHATIDYNVTIMLPASWILSSA